MAKRIICRGIHGQPPAEDGGPAERVLVDRAWPDGVRRRDAPVDRWLRDVAPSAGLQLWYGRHPRRFGEFRRRYLVELGDPAHRGSAARLRDLAGDHSLTLLTSARDTDRSHAAVLAEWLAGQEDPRTARPGPGRPRAALDDVNAAALAFVMGTGIVSTCLYADGAHVLSAALLWVALAGFAVLVPAYGLRLVRHRQRFVADLLGPRAFAFLTLAISSNVLGARFVLEGHLVAAGAFLAFGTLMWLVLDYGVPLALITSTRREPALDQVNGTWFLWAVASESVAVGAAALARPVPGHALPVLAVVCWAVGLVQYLLTAGIVLARLLVRPVRPSGLMTSVWIFMGAAAIAVLAGARLVALPQGSLLPARPLVIGSSVVLWSFSSWLIPLLLALGVWRHVLRRVPLRYELGWWNLVFPVGMYAVATHELGRVTGASWMTAAGRWEIWVAAVFWAVVFAAMAVAAAGRVTGARRAAASAR
ncbi:DUF488 family protein [Streptomyces sp. NPDC048663]|uniref:SLAC1 family transporter n=1 Tax=Streptomyces sp. NPDC048663 TaxID=3155638 RepID=UPI00343F8E9C